MVETEMGIVDLSNIKDVNKSAYPDIEEYYVYTPKPNYPIGVMSPVASGREKNIKIAKDSITYVTSGLFDRNKGTCLSYMHKAIKALNQLRMIEDSLVIYQIIKSTRKKNILY